MNTHSQAAVPLRAVMEQLDIQIVDHGFDLDLPGEIDYQGRMRVMQVVFRGKAIYCPVYDPTAEYYEKERWTAVFPDWEARLLYVLLENSEEVHWYQQGHGAMEGWLYANGRFQTPAEDAYEWGWQCRNGDQLLALFGIENLGRLRQASEKCDWNYEGTDFD